MQPRFNSISAYEDEISKHQEALKALNKQQFNLMLKNDVMGMDALDAPIKQAEKDIDNLKLEMYEVMGAYERGRKGNQLLEDDGKSYINGMLHAYGNIGDGLKTEKERKEEAERKGMLHVYGNMGDGLKAEQQHDAFFGYRPEDYEEPSDALFGKRPRDYEGETGGNNSGGGYRDFLREQRDKDEAINKTESVNSIWDLGYPTGPSPVEGPPPREEDMDKYNEDVEESLAAGETGLKKWWDRVADFAQTLLGGENDTESLPGPQPQAPPSEFVWEEKDDTEDAEKRKRDNESFEPALQELIEFSNKNQTDDISAYAKAVVDKIINNEKLDKAGFFQVDPTSIDSVYLISMEDADVELEVLSQAALPQYGGQGTEPQENLEKLKQLFWPPGGNEVTTVIGVIVDAIKEHYNPGQILQPGDVRITVTSPNPIGNQSDINIESYGIDYFFRGADLLYSKEKNTGVIAWGEKYKKYQ